MAFTQSHRHAGPALGIRAVLSAATAGAALFIAALFATALAAGGGKSMFQDTTYEELRYLPESDRMIAAVQCDETALVNQGSRSERVLITVRVLAGADGVKYEAPLRLTRYAQGDKLMKPGETYVVAAYRGEWLPAWNLVDYKLVDRSGAAAAVRAARDELAARAQGNKP
jgi:hypothetical protein